MDNPIYTFPMDPIEPDMEVNNFIVLPAMGASNALGTTEEQLRILDLECDLGLLAYALEVATWNGDDCPEWNDDERTVNLMNRLGKTYYKGRI